MWFCLNDTATTEFYTYLHTLSLHDALPISLPQLQRPLRRLADPGRGAVALQERQGKQGRARPAGRRQDRRDRRHPPAAAKGRPIPGSGTGDRRRGTALRRTPTESLKWMRATVERQSGV